MLFRLRQPAPVGKEPEFDCIVCDKPAIHSSEAASTATTRTVEVFCRHCGARQTVTTRLSPEGKSWELVS